MESKSPDLVIQSLNMRGKFKIKQPFIQKHINKHAPDVLFIQETHLAQEDEPFIQWKGYTAYYNSLTKRQILKQGKNRRRGVLTLVKNDLAQGILVESNTPHNMGRVIVLRLIIHKFQFILTNLYAPNHHQERKTMWKTVARRLQSSNNKIRKIKKCNSIKSAHIIGGDWNTPQAEKDTSGAFKKGPANALKQAIHQAFSLKDVSKDEKNTHTWHSLHSKGRKQSSRIDYFLSDQPQLVTNKHTSSPFLDTDHSLITLGLHMTFKQHTTTTPQRKKNPPPEWIQENAKLLNQQISAIATTNPEQYHMEVAKLLNQYHDPQSTKHTSTERPNKALSRIKLLVKAKSITTNPPYPNSSTWEKHLRKWLRASTIMSLPPLEDLQQIDIQTSTAQLIRTELNARNQAWKTKITRRINRHIQQLIDNRNVAGENRSQAFYHKLSVALYGKRPNRGAPKWITHPTKPDQIVTSPCKVRQLTQQHWAKHFKRTQPTKPPPSTSSMTFTLQELEQVLSHLTDSAPGPDRIPYALWKNLDTPNRVHLLQVINSTHTHTPDSWKEALQWGIPKGDNAENVATHRPIALQNTLYKIKMHLIKHRLELTLQEEKILNGAQSGFRKNYCTSQNIIAIKTILQNANLHKDKVHALLIDIKSAYDSVPHEAIWEVLSNTPELKPYAYPIYEMYTNATTQVITHWGPTEPIHITRGVRQGDPLSPTLFNLFINQILNQMTRKRHGVKAKGNTYTTLAYADDLIIFGHKRVQVQQLTQRLAHFLSQHGMSFNTSKFQYITNTQHKHINIEDSRGEICRIQCMQKVKYLGCTIAPREVEIEAETMLNNTRQRAEKILHRKLLPHIKAAAINALVYSKILYSFQHTTYPLEKLAKMDKEMAQGIRTSCNAWPFPSKKVHLPAKDGGWGLLNLEQMYIRLRTGTFFDRVLCREGTSNDIVRNIAEDNDQREDIITWAWKNQTQHQVPTIQTPTSLLNNLGYSVIDSRLNLLHPKVFFNNTTVSARARGRGITNITSIPDQDQNSLLTMYYQYTTPQVPYATPFTCPERVDQEDRCLFDTRGRRLVWTDGGKTASNTTAAIFWNVESPHNACLELPRQYTSFDAEVLAAIWAILQLPERGRVTVVTDSLSLVHALTNRDNPHRGIQYLQRAMAERNNQNPEAITFQHVYSHTKRKLTKNPSKWGPRIQALRDSLAGDYRRMHWGNKKVDALTSGEPTLSLTKQRWPTTYKYSLFNTGTNGTYGTTSPRWELTNVSQTLRTLFRTHTRRSADQYNIERFPDSSPHALSNLIFLHKRSSPYTKDYIRRARNLCLQIPDRKGKPATCPRCNAPETHQHILQECPTVKFFFPKLRRVIHEKLRKRHSRDLLVNIDAMTWRELTGEVGEQWLAALQQANVPRNMYPNITADYQHIITKWIHRITLRTVTKRIKQEMTLRGR